MGKRNQTELLGANGEKVFEKEERKLSKNTRREKK